jgi:hypothetical protein
MDQPFLRPWWFSAVRLIHWGERVKTHFLLNSLHPEVVPISSAHLPLARTRHMSPLRWRGPGKCSPNWTDVPQKLNFILGRPLGRLDSSNIISSEFFIWREIPLCIYIEKAAKIGEGKHL